jgi:hypothetical protein
MSLFSKKTNPATPHDALRIFRAELSRIVTEAQSAYAPAYALQEALEAAAVRCAMKHAQRQNF